MSVPTLTAQRQTDVARFYDSDLPNVESAATSGVDGSFLVRMEYVQSDPEGADRQRDEVWARVLKSAWAQPAYRDTVTIAGTDWRVALVTQADAWQWRLKLEKNVRVGFGGAS